MAGAIIRQSENGGARSEADKFYTKHEVAFECLQTLKELFANTDLIVEPSAGAGAFSSQIPNVIAFDLFPENPKVHKKDWFKVTRDDIGRGRLTVIGNPPFGVRADLAKRFIQHAVDLQAETIAFILPSTFTKISNQRESLFPADYRLVIEQPLPFNSFVLDGEDYHVPCHWFVWTTTDFRKDVNLRKKRLPSSPDFVFETRGSKTADFVINGNNGRLKALSEVSNPKAEHYIRVTDREQVDIVRTRFKSLNLSLKSSVSGGVAWAGQQEILAAYELAKKQENTE